MKAAIKNSIVIGRRRRKNDDEEEEEDEGDDDDLRPDVDPLMLLLTTPLLLSLPLRTQ